MVCVMELRLNMIIQAERRTWNLIGMGNYTV